MTSDGVFAVVVNYCQLDETLGCVEALRETGLPGSQIVVVDNASPDGSGSRLKRRLTASRVLTAPENSGYGAGNNLAIEYLLEERGRAEHIAIFNPDIRVQANTLEGMVAAFRGRDRVGGVSCVQWTSTGRDALDPVFESWIRNQAVDPSSLDEDHFFQTSSLLGAAMMLSRSALERVGGFDPLYFMYGEEHDVARRLRYHGYEIGVAGGAHVVHRRPYLDSGESRDFQRRTSGYLFLLKDPFSPIGWNILRMAKRAAGSLWRSLTEEERDFRGWLRELGWVLRRVPRGLVHRLRERRGPMHLVRARDADRAS